MDTLKYHYLCLRVLSEYYRGIDTSLYKQHKLNDFLGFGFKKDDIKLEALKDRWTSWDAVPIDRVRYWAERKLAPYSKHGVGISERIAIDEVIDRLNSQVIFLISEVHKNETTNPRGIELCSVPEVKTAVIFSAAIFLSKQEGLVPIPKKELQDEIKIWENKLKKIQVNEITRAENFSCDPFYAPLRKLMEEVQEFIKTAG